MNEQDQIKALRDIINLRDTDKGCRLLSSNWEEGSSISQGQFIFALHPFTSPMHCVGFAVQVRKGAGAFGSDIVLIRLANGRLQAWENQGFFGMTQEQELIARQTFSCLPEDEDYSEGYTTHDKVHETGFVVKNPQKVEPAVSHNVAITITDGQSDG